MELIGEQIINASRAQVWAAINDPDILQRCVPGCESIKAVSDTQREAVVMLKMGPVRARFSGQILLSDIQEPSSCRLTFEGTGGAAGFAKGHSQVELQEEGTQTRLRYTVSASVGGKLGQIGGRLIDSAARKIADEFFTALDAALSPDAGSVATPGVEPAAPDISGSAPTIEPAKSIDAARPLSSGAAGCAILSEVSRAFWFCLGVGTTLLVSYLAR